MNIQPLLSGRVRSKEQASQETGMPDEILKKTDRPIERKSRFIRVHDLVAPIA